ncbi:hypothetical protein Pfo_012946 [Paulownia fortunei]|nr:hypothetical protein Pfo_012946 [Paulownia fortunei]
MAKRGYKLQEFVAHAGNVNCLSFGKKNCRVFITGGDDQKVNLWSVGKPTSLMSLCGHTSPVESAAFDSAEVLVVAGSSSGAIKLWDLEETKMVRTLTGHRSYCTAVEFHPFGEFFASGSMDTNLKIWDIRKKGCIHTYKGHTRGISTIRFTPDGRWVVSGGFDNVVKVWDLTAGKLLHDFKFHEGHVRSIEFHPLEFLLATGSADKTVKFWDLETFEMIGSARREATGVRSITFHPDGRTLFCGLDDSLKVYSWEPVICHDSVDMGWSTLGDLCIQDGKLLGGAYYENSVAVWVADVSLIEPYGTRLAPEQHSHSEQKCDSQGSLSEKEESHVKSKSNVRSTTPDSDSKEIKTIYVDRVNSISSKTVDSVDVPKVVHPSDSKEISAIGIQKRGPAASLPAKANAPAVNKSLIMPSIVPRDGPDGKDSVGSRRESIASAKASSGMSAKPPHTRRLSSSRFDMERMSVSLDSVPYDNMKSPLGSKKESNLRNRLVADENAKESSEGKQSNIKIVAEKFDRTSSPATASSDQTLNSSKGVNPVKVVNGVVVVHGRTRSLVERFERKEKLDVDAICTPERASGVAAEPVATPPSQNSDQQIVMREQSTLDDNNVIENLMQSHDVLLSTFRSRLTKLQVVRHFWERNDMKGAINAVRKLPDHSVQADVVGVLIERMEIITLDLFSCLLPVLLGLLESKAERHASVSLEMLLKLVAVFGTVVRSTVSAPPAVGVDLHAEERLECCKQCFAHLQNIQNILPELVKRGGVVARCAQQLNLVLQQTRVWGTWEELILGAAVLRHGAQDWNVVASELRARTLYPTLFTPEICKAKYEDLQKRYSGSGAWFEELRKQCVAELKRELARSEDVIGSLESKIKYLEAEKQNSNQAVYGASQTESPLPALSSDGTESSSKKISKDEHSAGSFTKDTRTRTNWLCERHHQEMETDTRPDASVSSDHDKDLSIEKLAEGGYGQGVTIRKRRGQRKRKDCTRAVKEGSVDESDNLGSSYVVSTTQKDASTSNCDQIIRDSGMNNHNGGAYTVKRHVLMEIFQSIARTEPAVVFRHRMDSQKRARYRKVIRQHLDIGMIRSRIIGQSIKSAKELFRDLLLLANNALVFYSRRTREYKSALSLRHLVMNEYKQHCRGPCHEATSAFLPFNPPVKPRSARPRPPPCKDNVSEKLSNVENIVPANTPKALEKPCDSDYNVSLHSLLKAKKGLKRPAKVKPELADARPKSSPVKQRKRVLK